MKQTHAIIDGAVFCADKRRPVELEDCFACPHLIDLRVDTPQPRVVCDIPDKTGR
jgi:hypothetical protein